MAHSTSQLEQLNSVKLLVGLEFHNLVISLVGTSGFIFFAFFSKSAEKLLPNLPSKVGGLFVFHELWHKFIRSN